MRWRWQLWRRGWLDKVVGRGDGGDWVIEVEGEVMMV